MHLPFSKSYILTEINLFGEANFHHLGTIIQESQGTIYADLKFIRDSIQKVDVAFYRLSGVTIEVVRPYDSNSPIRNALDNGIFFHHICYAVPCIKTALELSKKHGVRRISQISPAKAFNNRLITWTYSRKHGLIELLEKTT